MAVAPLVLVVDDYQDAREMYAEYLKQSGFRVEEARTGIEAVAKALAVQPDCILMDLSLPGIDGWEATRQLKADPKTKDIPVVAITGHASELASRDAASSGWASFVLKPALPDAVVAEVRKSDRRVTSASRSVPLVRIGAERSRVRDEVAVEEPMEVRVNGAPFAVIMRTPGADRELAAGFPLAEDVIRSSDELLTIEECEDTTEEGRGNTLNVTVGGDAIERLSTRLGERRQVMMTSSCGLCGRRTIETLRTRVATVDGNWSISAAELCALPARLRDAQRVFETTGGLHAAGLFDRDGTLRHVAEDVGRHNAVDKIIGRHVLQDALPLNNAIMLVSGRTSFELVQKALLAGIPFVAAVSAPSSLAIELAQASGITLCGFVRGDRFNVYAHDHRVG